MINEYLFDDLKEEGKRLNIPLNKPRALVREYLQSKIIYYLYENKTAGKLSFIGGTSLRILKGLDRFSEDLDFDNLGLNFSQIKNLFKKVKDKLEKEGFEIDYEMKKTNSSGIGKMKFKDLLFQFKISSHREENLLIKIDYTTPRIKPEIETVVLNRFGIIQNVTTNTLGFLLTQKMRAILERKDLQPRDFYDVVWFLSHKISPDKKLFLELGIESKKELFLKLENIYCKQVKPNIDTFKKRLRPFLIDEKKVYYLDLFGDLIREQK